VRVPSSPLPFWRGDGLLLGLLARCLLRRLRGMHGISFPDIQCQCWRTPVPGGPLGPLPLRRMAKRDKLNLDLSWLKDKGLEDAENLPDPDELAREIADNLETALEQFRAIISDLKE
jgi:hypothetical protein